MARAIWQHPGNPTNYAADRVIIYDDGMVTDERGEPLGNIYDEL